MTAATVSSRTREVLGAPRGHRFSRPSHTSRPAPLTREQRLLAQMRDNPRVAYRLEHGTLPHWMRVAEERRDQRRRASPEPSVPAKDLPRAVGGGRHRKPRSRRPAWWVLSHGVATAGGTLLGQVMAMLA